jgi:hypothetical protein
MQRYIDFVLTKTIGGACIGLLFIVIFNQFFNSTFTGWIQIILLFYIFAFLGTKLYIFNRTLSGIRSGRNLPKPYADHPVYQTNIAEYEIVADKVRDFTCAVLIPNQIMDASDRAFIIKGNCVSDAIHAGVMSARISRTAKRN